MNQYPQNADVNFPSPFKCFLCPSMPAMCVCHFRFARKCTCPRLFIVSTVIYFPAQHHSQHKYRPGVTVVALRYINILQILVHCIKPQRYVSRVRFNPLCSVIHKLPKWKLFPNNGLCSCLHFFFSSTPCFSLANCKS